MIIISKLSGLLLIMGREKRRNPFAGFGQNLTLQGNKFRGRMAEEQTRMGYALSGHDVRKVHKGADFVCQKRDLWGNPVGKPFKVEVKTGGSRLSEAQQKEKRRLGRRYKVERY
jgi:hypothetical protein